MPQYQISLKVARALHLAAQGLLTVPRKKATKQSVIETIQQMGLLQIDTINVVARSPYLVLFSRIGHYDPKWLEEALATGALFEYWAHEACFIPMEDYALFGHRMATPDTLGWKYSKEWAHTHQVAIQQLLEYIEVHGPVRAVDFKNSGESRDGWWDWKPEKKHLETLFTSGQLMVRARHNFHRVYDLAERVRPTDYDSAQTPSKEVAEFIMLQKSCQALGIITPEWLADYYRLKNIKPSAVLDTLSERGELIPIRIEGFKKISYLHHSLQPLLAKAEADTLHSQVTTLLSPFDPVVWDRRRATQLFNFEYRLECYTPEAKRQYGYFCLPILHRGCLIGRLDAKLHRGQGIMEIKALYLEPQIKITQTTARALEKALLLFAQWQRATTVVLQQLPTSLTKFWSTTWCVPK